MFFENTLLLGSLSVAFFLSVRNVSYPQKDRKGYLLLASLASFFGCWWANNLWLKGFWSSSRLLIGFFVIILGLKYLWWHGCLRDLHMRFLWWRRERWRKEIQWLEGELANEDGSDLVPVGDWHLARLRRLRSCLVESKMAIDYLWENG